MTTEPLSPAEAAVVAVLSGESECTWHVVRDAEECYEPRARAVVAAVKPLIAGQAAANVLNSVADWIGKAALSNPNGVTVTEIVSHLRRRAELSRPTPEETR